MKTVVAGKTSQSPTVTSASPERGSPTGISQAGRYSQLAALTNASSRVQAQLKLAGEMQNSAVVQRALGWTAAVNAHEPGAPESLAGEHNSAAQLFASEGERVESQGNDTGLSKTQNSGPNRTGMPDAIKQSMEQSFQANFSDVRVHADSSRAGALGAVALASGNDIHFAPGRYEPNSRSGKQVLGHELAHVVQQREGRVRATTQAKGVSLNLDPGLERSADEQGAKAARGEPARTGVFLHADSEDPSADVAQGFGLLEAGLIIGGLAVGKLMWNYYQGHYKGQPKSEEEMLAGRIADDPRAKQEISDLLAQRVGGDVAEENEAQFVMGEAQNHDLRIDAGELGPNSRPFVPDAVHELRQIAGAVGGTASGWVEGVLKRQINWLKNRQEQSQRQAGLILELFYNKAVTRFLAHEHTQLPPDQQTTGPDQARIDPQFLSDQRLLDLVGTLVDTHRGDQVNLTEAQNADQILTQVQGQAPLEKFYALARYLVNHKATKSPTQRQINRALRAELVRDITAYLVPVPAARQTTNAGQYIFPQILDSATNAPVANTSAIVGTANQARTEIVRVVSGTVIERSGACNLIAHNSWTFRPHWLNNTVHARVNAPVKSLMHEYGHHLENNALPTRWLKLQQMLHQRSAGNELQSIWPFFTIPRVVSTEELQYAATMPAWWDQGGWFGYSAKYYTSGHTELVSTVLEVFANHNKIINIALKDPELFIAVLKVIRE